MITWSTVAMTGGAILLGDVDLAPTDADSTAQVAVAAADAYPDALAPERALDPYADIRQADLEEVTFTATGDSPDPVIADARPMGRVTAEAVNLRAGPGTGFAIVGRATEGQRLPVTGARDGVWLEVELAGVDGPAWVHGRYFEAPGG
jgi:hypothetical protein